MTAAVANPYETLLTLGDCRLVLDRRRSELLLSWTGQRTSHFDSCIALAMAQGLVAAVRAKQPGPVVQIPRHHLRNPQAQLEYFTRIWVSEDDKVWFQTQGPHCGPAYSFDVFETITLVQGLISGVRALEGWR